MPYLILDPYFQGLDEFGSTPLILATRTNQILIVDFLIGDSAEIDLNATEKVRFDIYS
jgi:hypothetical protein